MVFNYRVHWVRVPNYIKRLWSEDLRAIGCASMASFMFLAVANGMRFHQWVRRCNPRARPRQLSEYCSEIIVDVAAASMSQDVAARFGQVARSDLHASQPSNPAYFRSEADDARMSVADPKVYLPSGVERRVECEESDGTCVYAAGK
jgi:hypothetical protein